MPDSALSVTGSVCFSHEKKSEAQRINAGPKDPPPPTAPGAGSLHGHPTGLCLLPPLRRSIALQPPSGSLTSLLQR